MASIDALYVKAEGWTAFFKHPLTLTGTQITLPCPPYSTILGFISTCAGRVIDPDETRIGYEFRSISTDVELERTDRLAFNKKGQLSSHPEGKGIIKRYVHFNISLDLFLTNVQFDEYFHNPISTPCIGRSQDLVWIKEVRKITMDKVSSGSIGPTMLSATSTNSEIPSLIIRCPEWFMNDYTGRTRITGPIGYYYAIPSTTKNRIRIEMDHLYHPSNYENPENVIYLHKWL